MPEAPDHAAVFHPTWHHLENDAMTQFQENALQTIQRICDEVPGVDNGLRASVGEPEPGADGLVEVSITITLYGHPVRSYSIPWEQRHSEEVPDHHIDPKAYALDPFHSKNDPIKKRLSADLQSQVEHLTPDSRLVLRTVHYLRAQLPGAFPGITMDADPLVSLSDKTKGTTVHFSDNGKSLESNIIVPEKNGQLSKKNPEDERTPEAMAKPILRELAATLRPTLFLRQPTRLI